LGLEPRLLFRLALRPRLCFAPGLLFVLAPDALGLEPRLLFRLALRPLLGLAFRPRLRFAARLLFVLAPDALGLAPRLLRSLTLRPGFRFLAHAQLGGAPFLGFLLRELLRLGLAARLLLGLP